MNTLKIAVVALLAAASAAQAQAPAAPAQAPQSLVPAAAAPSKSVADVDLGVEYPDVMKNYRFTQTVSTVQPNTGREMHRHNMPEIVYVISGTLTDSRNGGPPTAYGPGSTLLNLKGVSHMWANLGKEPVVFISTAIRPPPSPPAQGR